MQLRSGPKHDTITTNWDDYFKREWHRLHAGVDYPREMDWMEVKRLFGGAIMAVGMD